MKIIFVLLLMIPQITFAGGVLQPNTVQQPRDPFSVSRKMQAAVGNQNQFGSGFGQFSPSYGGSTVPKMKLKGFVTKNKKKATALLEVAGAGVYMVSKGDQIGLHAIGLNTVLEVIDINSNGVKVRAGLIDQVIVVR